MKIIKLMSGSLLLCGIAFSSLAQTRDIVINGKLNNMAKMPAKIYLIYTLLLNQKPDSAQVIDGKYKIVGSSGSIIAAATLTSNINNQTPPNVTQIILDKGELQVYSDGDLQHTKVSGSASKPQLEYEAILAPIKDTVAILNKQAQSDQFKTDEAFKTKVQAAIMVQVTHALQRLFDYPLQHPNSVLTPYLTWSTLKSGSIRLFMIDSLQRNLPAGTPAIFKNAVAEIRDQTAKAQAEYDARTKANDAKIPLGSKAMGFSMNNTEGKPVSLSSFKGKYVLIDFWASWCGPCRGENPNLVKAYNTYKDKGFTILGISLDGPSQKEAWLTAIKKDGLIWTQVSELNGFSNSVAKMYFVDAIPKNFLIDPNGVIIAKNLRGNELEEKLKSLFNK